MNPPGRIAVADLGTNSTRLLVADVTGDGEVTECARLSEVTRLGQEVDSSGQLAEEAMERVHQCLGRYRRKADALDAKRLVAVATSAVRDSSNGKDFQEAVRERSGFDVRTIGGDEEARLTFLGATARSAAGGGPVLVIDIGGGSTEYVTGRPRQAPDFHVSTRLGSVRQTERHLTDDPPPHADLEELATGAREIIAADVPLEVREAVRDAVAVAGTATSLAAIDQELEPYDSARVDGYTLLLGECERMQALLAALPLADREDLAGLHPDRAPTIVAGATILIESMRAFGLDHVRVSEADILHGVVLDLGGPT